MSAVKFATALSPPRAMSRSTLYGAPIVNECLSVLFWIYIVEVNCYVVTLIYDHCSYIKCTCWKLVFAKDFAEITDLEVGPDGYLYVVSLGHGAIYKILPASGVVSTTDDVEDVVEEEEEDPE